MTYTKEQQQENRTKFTEALRSGEYKQTNWHLKDEFGCFCAMGVACDVFAKNSPGVVWGQHRGETRLVFDGRQPFFGDLMPLIYSYYGIDYQLMVEIVRLNDLIGASFDDIADHVDSFN